jgi:hypothetical protein
MVSNKVVSISKPLDTELLFDGFRGRMLPHDHTYILVDALQGGVVDNPLRRHGDALGQA